MQWELSLVISSPGKYGLILPAQDFILVYFSLDFVLFYLFFFWLASRLLSKYFDINTIVDFIPYFILFF